MDKPSPRPARPLRVAVVGSGPAGLFTADELLRRRPGTTVDVFERLPAPFGLVRYGVAPDHPHTRRATKLLEGVLARPGVRLHANRALGHDLALADLRADFDAVVLATGAPLDRRLDLPGEDLPGVWPSTAFAGWVNGHPDFRDHGPLPATDTALILGHGNVALDAARLLARPAEFLATTDIAPAAGDELARHSIRHILLVGRRGPAQAAFGLAELEELATLPGWTVSAEPAAFPLAEACREELAAGDDRAREVAALLEKLSHVSPPAPSERRIEILFHRLPLAFAGGTSVEVVHFSHSRLEGPAGARRAVATGEYEELAAGLVIKAVGHLGQPVAGAPFDAARGLIPHQAGRVERGLYVVGWIKRGAKGLIGHNRRDAMETAATLLADFP